MICSKRGLLLLMVARNYSEDAGTAKTVDKCAGSSQVNCLPNIEEKVFALKDSLEYTAPIQSDYGWHIFQFSRSVRCLPMKI